VSPAVDDETRRELALHRLGDESEHLDVAVALERQRDAVRRRHGDALARRDRASREPPEKRRRDGRGETRAQQRAARDHVNLRGGDARAPSAGPRSGPAPRAWKARPPATTEDVLRPRAPARPGSSSTRAARRR